jgi:hypothetical protein
MRAGAERRDAAVRPANRPAIGQLYPAPVLYLASTALVLGNALFLYLFLLGTATRGQWDLVKYGLFAPVYWLMMSVAACYALGQLIRRPHYWEKTVHGLHLQSGGPDLPAAHGTVAEQAA